MGKKKKRKTNSVSYKSKRIKAKPLPLEEQPYIPQEIPTKLEEVDPEVNVEIKLNIWNVITATLWVIKDYLLSLVSTEVKTGPINFKPLIWIGGAVIIGAILLLIFN